MAGWVDVHAGMDGAAMGKSARPRRSARFTAGRHGGGIHKAY